MENNKSKVYALLNEHNIVTKIDGGYTIDNIKDIENWTFIEEGEGDKYNLCQSHYLEDGLINEYGIFLYEYNGKINHRNQSIIDQETQEKQAQEQKQQQIAELKQFMTDTDYIWNVIKEGDATEEDYADIIAQRHETRLRIRELEG